MLMTVGFVINYLNLDIMNLVQVFHPIVLFRGLFESKIDCVLLL